MDKAAAVTLEGRDYMIVPREEYDRLRGLARVAEMPPLPRPDADGDYPAVEYARASLARKMVRARVQAGLSQAALARLAGVRNETLCRIETGKHTPRVATITRIDRALKGAAGKRAKQGGRRLR